jgi:hypothetical protein
MHATLKSKKNLKFLKIDPDLVQSTKSEAVIVRRSYFFKLLNLYPYQSRVPCRLSRRSVPYWSPLCSGGEPESSTSGCSGQGGSTGCLATGTVVQTASPPLNQLYRQSFLIYVFNGPKGQVSRYKFLELDNKNYTALSKEDRIGTISWKRIVPTPLTRKTTIRYFTR